MALYPAGVSRESMQQRELIGVVKQLQPSIASLSSRIAECQNIYQAATREVVNIFDPHTNAIKALQNDMLEVKQQLAVIEKIIRDIADGMADNKDILVRIESNQ